MKIVKSLNDSITYINIHTKCQLVDHEIRQTDRQTRKNDYPTNRISNRWFKVYLLDMSCQKQLLSHLGLKRTRPTRKYFEILKIPWTDPFSIHHAYLEHSSFRDNSDVKKSGVSKYWCAPISLKLPMELSLNQNTLSTHSNTSHMISLTTENTVLLWQLPRRF